MLIPSRLGFSLNAMSAWTRTIVVPLAIMAYHKPVRTLPAELGIAELFRADCGPPSRRTDRWFSWTNFFLGVDRVLKVLDRWVPAAWRQPGVRAAHRWMLDHCENTDGLGAIFPPMVYSIIALRSLDYDLDSPMVQWALRQLDDLHIAEHDRVRIQPCVSPVWDTAIVAIALADAQVPAEHPAWARAIEWLLAKEIRNPGDWQIRRTGVEPTGWHFQFHNAFYPDLDDSAMVILALNRSPLANDPAVQAATRRGVNWLLAMQNRDGGWAAYDIDIDNQVLTQLPFADHNAMLDPSCADITARVVEMLGILGYRANHPAVARALEYLWSTQEPEGCWYGRWGVNYVYGTWQVLQGLKAIDFPMDHPALVKAADWLESVQQPSGAWGETCRSYDDPELEGHRRAHAVADCLGHAGTHRGRPRIFCCRSQWHRLPDPDPVARRLVARSSVHGHWISPSFLPSLSLLRNLFSLDGDRAIPGRHRRRISHLFELSPGVSGAGSVALDGLLKRLS